MMTTQNTNKPKHQNKKDQFHNAKPCEAPPPNLNEQRARVCFPEHQVPYVSDFSNASGNEIQKEETKDIFFVIPLKLLKQQNNSTFKLKNCSNTDSLNKRLAPRFSSHASQHVKTKRPKMKLLILFASISVAQENLFSLAIGQSKEVGAKGVSTSSIDSCSAFDYLNLLSDIGCPTDDTGDSVCTPNELKSKCDASADGEFCDIELELVGIKIKEPTCLPKVCSASDVDNLFCLGLPGCSASSSCSGLPGYAIAIIVIVVIFLVAGIAYMCWRKGKKQKRDEAAQPLNQQQTQTNQTGQFRQLPSQPTV